MTVLVLYNTHMKFINVLLFEEEWGSSVNIVTSPRAGQPGVRFPSGQEGYLFIRHSVQTGSKNHATSYPFCTCGSFLGDKASGA